MDPHQRQHPNLSLNPLELNQMNRYSLSAPEPSLSYPPLESSSNPYQRVNPSIRDYFNIESPGTYPVPESTLLQKSMINSSRDSFTKPSPPTSAHSKTASSVSTRASTIRLAPADQSYNSTSSSSNIRVVVRIRPKTDYEISRENSPKESSGGSTFNRRKTNDTIRVDDKEKMAISCASDGRTLLLKEQNQTSNVCVEREYEGHPPRTLTFHRVYEEYAEQESVFDDCGVKDLVVQAINGYAATVFAFGQTGSGKTFTITGPEYGWNTYPERLGIIPRALEFLFEDLFRRTRGLTPRPAGQPAPPNVSYKVKANYLEIYNELVQDLLSPITSSSSSLPVRWTAERGFYVEHAIAVECQDLDDCMAVLEEGLKNRRTGAHRLNESSSRSHSIMTVYIESASVDAEDGGPVSKCGKISFVDLAGSERVRESKAHGDTLTETMNINQSLLTLGNCISALADPKKRNGHIPYRDSNLTRLLADSLGGSGLALMIACISPSRVNLQESLKTLRYASRARKIRNRPVVQMGPVADHMVALRREVNGLRRENAALRAAVEGRVGLHGLLDVRSQVSSSASSLVSEFKLPDISASSAGSLSSSRSSMRGRPAPVASPSPYLSRFLRSQSRTSLDESVSLPPLVLRKATEKRSADASVNPRAKPNAHVESMDAPKKEAIPSRKSSRSRIPTVKTPGSNSASSTPSSKWKPQPPSGTPPEKNNSSRDSTATLHEEPRTPTTPALTHEYPLTSLEAIVALKRMTVNDVDALDREIGLMSQGTQQQQFGE